MDDDKVTEMLLKISNDTAEIKADIRNIDKRLDNHETRIVILEKQAPEKDSWKNQLLMLLAKAIVIGGVAVGSLAGGGHILQKVFCT